MVAQRRQARWRSGGKGGGGGKRVAPRGRGALFKAGGGEAGKGGVSYIRGSDHGKTGGGRATAAAAVVQTWSAHGWAPAVSDFSNLSKIGWTLKIKMGVVDYFKNSQFLHVASFRYHKQFSQLC
jgi:hypothetical protein